MEPKLKLRQRWSFLTVDSVNAVNAVNAGTPVNA